MNAGIKLESIQFGVTNDKGKDLSRVGADIAEIIRLKTQESEKDKGENDEKMMTKIMAKIKRGKKLSSKETTYLKEHNPELYLQYLRIRRMADALESQLKSASSKEEVNDIIMFSMGSISDKDPYKEFIIAALNEVVKEFKNSDAYNMLPSQSEEACDEKKASKDKRQEGDSAEAGEDDDFDPMSWSPLQEIVDSMPTFDSPA